MQYVLDRSESITVNTVLDLPRLKQVLEVLHLKPNYSELSRQLGCDRRTVKAYYEKGHLVKNEKDNLRLIVFMTLLRLCCQKILRKSLITYPLIMKHNYRKQFRICLLMR